VRSWRCFHRIAVSSLGDSVGVDAPFIGSEALRDGVVANKHQLRTRFRALYPDVYLPDGVSPTLSQRATAAWLWTRRGGVVAGLAAAAMHGARWIADDVPIELIWANPRPPRGIVTRRDRLGPKECQLMAGLPVTTPERTAFDVGRLIGGDRAVAHLDALGNVTRFDRMAVAGWPAGTVARLASLICGRLSASTTQARSRLARPGCDWFSLAPDFRGRKRRYPSSMTSAILAISSIWAGRTC
jgi:hypothetical protein